jgi:hypothetical protein
VKTGKVVTTLLVSGVLIGHANAADQGIQIVGGVDMAFKDVSLDVDAGLNVSLTTVKPNVAFAYKRLYGNIAYDRSVAPGQTTGLNVGGGPPYIPYTFSLSRTDLTATFGYRATDSLSVFVGWLDGAIHAIKNDQVDNGSGTLVDQIKNIDYARNGPFVGAAYSMRAGKQGSFNVSVAYASMSGSLREAAYSTAPEPPPSNTPVDAQGLSYGITWTGPLTDSISDRIGVNQTDYRGDITSGTLTERYTSVYFGATNYF